MVIPYTTGKGSAYRPAFLAVLPHCSSTCASDGSPPCAASRTTSRPSSGITSSTTVSPFASLCVQAAPILAADRPLALPRCGATRRLLLGEQAPSADTPYHPGHARPGRRECPGRLIRPDAAALMRSPLAPAAVYRISLTEDAGRSPPHNRPASSRQWRYREQQYKRLVEKGRRERCRQSCVSR
jgi:hypothetical protein